VDQRPAFQRLDPVTQAGQFGNAGRNIARGPGYANLDLSLVRNFALSQGTRLELRIESFNVTNHVNFRIARCRLEFRNFGRIFSAAPPRLMQFAAKLVF
jgi:hypothetical protein